VPEDSKSIAAPYLFAMLVQVLPAHGSESRAGRPRLDPRNQVRRLSPAHRALGLNRAAGRATLLAIAEALAQRAANSDDEVSATLQGFISANATRRFDVQLALPLQGAA
jgi:hypothetical protein